MSLLRNLSVLRIRGRQWLCSWKCDHTTALRREGISSGPCGVVGQFWCILTLDDKLVVILKHLDNDFDCVSAMSNRWINPDRLFDGDEYRKSGDCPWTFFAYPTSLATEHRLPPDDEACRFLGAIQARGIEVAIWVNGIATNTTYFACKRDDIERLNDAVTELENDELFGNNFCAKRSEALFALLENGS